MGKYKKTIAAAIAWVGTLCAAGSDLSLDNSEISALVIGALGVFAVYQARNKVA